jgi:hypothetical protein
MYRDEISLNNMLEWFGMLYASFLLLLNKYEIFNILRHVMRTLCQHG